MVKRIPATLRVICEGNSRILARVDKNLPLPGWLCKATVAPTSDQGRSLMVRDHGRRHETRTALDADGVSDVDVWLRRPNEVGSFAGENS